MPESISCISSFVLVFTQKLVSFTAENRRWIDERKQWGITILNFLMPYIGKIAFVAHKCKHQKLQKFCHLAVGPPLQLWDFIYSLRSVSIFQNFFFCTGGNFNTGHFFLWWKFKAFSHNTTKKIQYALTENKCMQVLSANSEPKIFLFKKFCLVWKLPINASKFQRHTK